MAKKVIKTTFQLRRGNSDTYTQKNILLAAGEPAFELDTGRLKIGDGETLWNDLDYINDKEFVYKPGGSRGTLPNLNDSNIGYVYNITEGFITTEDFIEGAGKYYSAGTDVTIIKINEDLYYNVYGGFVDLSGYATKTDLNSKETAMVIYTEIPINRTLVSNGYYTLQAAQDLEVLLPTGSTADDMIYLSVLAKGTLQIRISGNNYAPAIDIHLSNGDFAELIATWQPVVNKWLLASRVVNNT